MQAGCRDVSQLHPPGSYFEWTVAIETKKERSGHRGKNRKQERKTGRTIDRLDYIRFDLIFDST